MITDLFIRLVTGMFEGLAALLPSHDLPLPDLTGVVGWLADIDSVLPIGGVVTVAVIVLGFGVVFVSVRLALMAWKALPFT